jgi:hypothetical protein
MNRYLTAAALCLLSTTALAENLPAPHHPRPPAPKSTATATGTGVGIANSSSQSGAVAISGQGGQGGNSSLTVNSTTPSTTTSNVNQNLSGSTTSNINSRTEVSGTQTIKNVPSMVAPGLTAAGLETCLGSASGGVSAVGFGISGGSTYKDEDCTARLDSRTLFAMGLKSAAVARLCQRADIWRSMPDICARYWPAGMPMPYGVIVEPAGYTAPLPVRALMSTESGSIRVIDGRDGVEKDCANYSYTKLKCYQWAGEPRRQQTAALTPQRSVKPRPPKKPPPAEPVPASAPPAPDNR